MSLASIFATLSGALIRFVNGSRRSRPVGLTLPSALSMRTLIEIKGDR